MPKGMGGDHDEPRNSKAGEHLTERRNRHRETEARKGVAPTLAAQNRQARGPNRVRAPRMIMPTGNRATRPAGIPL